MTLRGTNQESGRPHNRRIILELLRRGGPMSRADIAAAVQLSIQTVSTITSELVDSGFLAATRGTTKGRGHPPLILAIRDAGGLAFGVQINPQDLRVALVDLGGNILGQTTGRLEARDPERALAEVLRLIEELGRLRPSGRFLGIGIAMPGPFGVRPMSFVGSTTLEGWQDVPIRRRIEQATGLPVFVEDNSACAAIGENQRGHWSDFYYIHFDVGLGGCAVVDNQLFRGAFGNAGELGHLPLGPVDEPCPCGNRGCLERVLSLDGLYRRLRRAHVADDPAALDAAVAADHPEVAGWLADAAPLLAKAVVVVENLFDPATVLIGGLLPRHLAERLIAVASPLPASVSEVSGRTLERVVCSPAGPDVALAGAGMLAISNVLSPRSDLAYANAVARARAYDPIVADQPATSRLAP